MFKILADVVGDAIVILAPIRLVLRATFSKPQKIRIITIFSTTIIMTAISLNHAFTVMLNGGGLTEALASLLQVRLYSLRNIWNCAHTQQWSTSLPSAPLSAILMLSSHLSSILRQRTLTSLSLWNQQVTKIKFFLYVLLSLVRRDPVTRYLKSWTNMANVPLVPISLPVASEVAMSVVTWVAYAT